jgi:hypothetical protein
VQKQQPAPTPATKQPQKNVPASKVQSPSSTKAKENEEDDDEEDDEEDDDEKYVPHIHLRKKEMPQRRRARAWDESIQARRLAEDHKTPRKSLLKQKKVKWL